MTSILKNISVDCADPYDLAHFWSEVFGVPVDRDDNPGDDEVGIPVGGGQELLFLKVPERKTVKNRAPRRRHRVGSARRPRGQ